MDYRESEVAQYWNSRVRILNPRLLSQEGYIKVAELRHTVTNYDELLRSREFKALDDSDREVAYSQISHKNERGVVKRDKLRNSTHHSPVSASETRK